MLSVRLRNVFAESAIREWMNGFQYQIRHEFTSKGHQYMNFLPCLLYLPPSVHPSSSFFPTFLPHLNRMDPSFRDKKRAWSEIVRGDRSYRSNDTHREYAVTIEHEWTLCSDREVALQNSKFSQVSIFFTFWMGSESSAVSDCAEHAAHSDEI